MQISISVSLHRPRALTPSTAVFHLALPPPAISQEPTERRAAKQTREGSENPFPGSSKVSVGQGCAAESSAAGTRSLRDAEETCRRPRSRRPGHIPTRGAGTPRERPRRRPRTEVPAARGRKLQAVWPRGKALRSDAAGGAVLTQFGSKSGDGPGSPAAGGLLHM